MKRVLPVLAVLASLSCTVAAQPAATTTGSLGDAVEITPQQRSVLKRYTVARHATPVRLRDRIVAGATVPDFVAFEPLPTAIISENLRLKGYSYFYADTGTYIVDPASRLVITSID
ncbi:DUF1236 domain-containing protein [Methylobacterium nigriterrae]|uniref:DUF1236 domain-containing protein n=1 Tax=Methylobacterium nigriterrae TaxID=3127512 RepID=UPI003013C4D0